MTNVLGKSGSGDKGRNSPVRITIHGQWNLCVVLVEVEHRKRNQGVKLSVNVNLHNKLYHFLRSKEGLEVSRLPEFFETFRKILILLERESSCHIPQV